MAASSLNGPAEIFVVLPENRLAFTAVAHRSARPATTLPPSIFLYGPAGCGKSHLARHAIRLLADTGSKPRYQHLNAGDLATTVDRKALSGQDLLEEFRTPLDLIVIEDVHALERYPLAQRFLTRLVDEFGMTGCQFLWTSRRSPGELAHFPKKLINRFQAGIMAALSMPGPDSRRELLQHFARLQQVPLSAEAISLLEKSCSVSPRELQALIGQLEQQARTERKALNSDFVRKFLAREVAAPATSLMDVARAVARHFEVTVTQLRSRTRVQGLVFPRQCALYLSRTMARHELGRIGKFYSGRDHSTVIHSCKRVTEELAARPEARQHLTQIMTVLGLSQPLPALSARGGRKEKKSNNLLETCEEADV